MDKIRDIIAMPFMLASVLLRIVSTLLCWLGGLIGGTYTKHVALKILEGRRDLPKL